MSAQLEVELSADVKFQASPLSDGSTRWDVVLTGCQGGTCRIACASRSEALHVARIVSMRAAWIEVRS